MSEQLEQLVEDDLIRTTPVTLKIPTVRRTQKKKGKKTEEVKRSSRVYLYARVKLSVRRSALRILERRNTLSFSPALANISTTSSTYNNTKKGKKKKDGKKERRKKNRVQSHKKCAGELLCILTIVSMSGAEEAGAAST